MGQTKIRFGIKRASPKHWEGTIYLPMGFGAAAVKAKGKTQAQALKNAASIAEKIAANPVLSAALPPGADVALKATKMLAKYGAKGALKKGLKKLSGKGAKRVVKALSSLW